MKVHLDFVRFCFVSFIALLSGPSYGAETFPTKPITIIVPFPPGADTDTSARLIAKHSEQFLGQPIIVKNKGGAAGTLGFNEGASAAADGYTVTVATPSLVVTPYTVKSARTYSKEFAAVALPAGAPFVLVVRADAPWNSLKQLTDYSRQHPGALQISNTGTAGLVHILTLGIEAATKASFTHVPYRGSGPGIVALLGGHVHGMLGAAGTVVAHVKSGKLKPLAIGAKQRYDEFPGAPTFKELGLDVDARTWWGYVVPKATPEHVVRALAAGLKKGMETPEYQKAANRLLWVVDYQGPEAFGRFLSDRDAEWSAIIKKLEKDGAIEPLR